MRRVIIVQARMTSTRLPGKILADLAGRPLLAQQLRRLKACRIADAIVLATTTLATDDPVIELARREDVGWFRGSEQDVLSRYVGAARESAADIVVRATADCPLIDPGETDRVIGELLGHATDSDYAANILQRTFPRGLDTEAFFMDVLLRMDRMARSDAAREHVTVLLRSERPELFRCRSVTDTENNADLRWTVDTDVDLRVIRTVYEELGLGDRVVPYRDILSYARSHPNLFRLNASQKTWTPP